jgi:hypothetical protein
MNPATETLLEFWKHPRNIPFKGVLISDDSLNLGEEPTTCMCAQGQALYMVGGYTEEDLRNIEQEEADKEVAKLLGISVTHSVLLRKINDGQPGAPSDVLTNPEKYLGKNHETVLNFWTFNDSLTEDNWNEVARRYRALDPAAGYAAWAAATDAALIHRAEHRQAVLAAGDAASATAGYAAWAAARSATYELIGDIENPVFVPFFDNLDT